jgi:hypothetical protein
MGLIGSDYMSLVTFFSRNLGFFTLFVMIAGCSVSGNENGRLASGNVVSIGNKHLVMQDGSHVMFVSVGEFDKQRLLKTLRKGDSITLMGKRDIKVLADGRNSTSADVYEVITSDGTRIALNH